MDNVDFEWR